MVVVVVALETKGVDGPSVAVECSSNVWASETAESFTTTAVSFHNTDEKNIVVERERMCEAALTLENPIAAMFSLAVGWNDTLELSNVVSVNTP